MFTRLPSRRRLVTSTLTLATAGTAYYTYTSLAPPAYADGSSIPVTQRRPGPLWAPPSRQQMLHHLRTSGRSLVPPPSAEEPAPGSEDRQPNKTAPIQDENSDEGIFDLLIVGGGATGAGVAVDAASRGLKVACVEREDFASGTSSKSTKLVHGGVRYLQKAIFELDYGGSAALRAASHR